MIFLPLLTGIPTILLFYSILNFFTTCGIDNVGPVRNFLSTMTITMTLWWQFEVLFKTTLTSTVFGHTTKPFLPVEVLKSNKVGFATTK